MERRRILPWRRRCSYFHCNSFCYLCIGGWWVSMLERFWFLHLGVPIESITLWIVPSFEYGFWCTNAGGTLFHKDPFWCVDVWTQVVGPVLYPIWVLQGVPSHAYVIQTFEALGWCLGQVLLVDKCAKKFWCVDFS